MPVFATTGQRAVTPPEGGRPACPLCGAELRLSHRQYAGGGRSAPVLRCTGCGNLVHGVARPDAPRHPPPAGRRRPLPDEGQPDNFVLDTETAERLQRALKPNDGAPDT